MKSETVSQTKKHSVMRTELLSQTKSLFIIILGNILMALATKLFLLPANLVTGGVTGIALVVNHFTGLSVSFFVLVFNVIMLILGYLVIGKKFAATTVVSTFAYPIALEVFERLFGDLVLTENLFLNCIFYGVGLGLALGIVIREGASTGGMDIPPIILNKYFKVPVSVGMYFFDFAILLMQAIVYPAEIVMYGVVLLIIYTLVLDKIMILGEAKTEIKIISKGKAEEIRHAILTNMDRGVTVLHGEGGYLRQDSEVLMSIIENRELARIERMILEIDPEAMTIISRVTAVKGRGFTLSKEYI